MIGEAIRKMPLAPARALHFAWTDESVRTPVIIFFILRLVTALGIFVMVQATPAPLARFMYTNPSGQTYFRALPPDSPLASLVAPWHRWDTAWYVKVAIQGYTLGDPSFVFPPLYPALIALLAPLCGNNYVLAAILISTIACFALFLLLYKLVVMEFADNILARNTLIVLATFPTAYYLMAGYTELLFMALILGAWVTALKKQWWLAEVLAFFASLTRIQGAILCLPLAWIAYVQLRDRGLPAIMERLPAVIGAPIGSACYYLYVTINHIGSFDVAFAKEWQLYTRLPMDSINAFIYRFTNHLTVDWENRNAYAVIFLFLMCLVVTFYQKPSYIIYSWATLIVLLMRYHEGPNGTSLPQFESLICYSLMMFPCFIATATLLSRWWQLVPYAIGGSYWGWILLDQFTHWKWVA